jgi:hypothetical protein
VASDVGRETLCVEEGVRVSQRVGKARRNEGGGAISPAGQKRAAETEVEPGAADTAGPKVVPDELADQAAIRAGVALERTANLRPACVSIEEWPSTPPGGDVAAEDMRGENRGARRLVSM